MTYKTGDIITVELRGEDAGAAIAVTQECEAVVIMVKGDEYTVDPKGGNVMTIPKERVLYAGPPVKFQPGVA